MATPANADVFRFHFHGKFAEAAWDVSTPTSDTFASVQATKDELFADVFTVTFDADGNLTGASDTFADVAGGYTFRIAKKYGSASVSGSGIPAQRCTYDANFDLIGCNDTTIGVNVTWTATGPLTHDTSNDHFKGDGFSFNDHFNGATREASASGTIAGHTFTADDVEFADLGRVNSGSIERCIGTAC